MRKIERQITLGPKFGIHDEQDLLVVELGTREPEFRHHVGIRQKLAAIGLADEGDVTDKNIAVSDLPKNGLAHRRRSSDACRIRVQFDFYLMLGFQLRNRRLKGNPDEIRADLPIAVALP
ncbi:hypothetical protein A6U85_31885 [Agrobacterium sp. 13-626]|nr:hypothetical protein A6U85_31885 [Agrobacterium sp. 13-626]